eukprot:2816673-Lingulodinium_polyedra.AAC.1
MVGAGPPALRGVRQQQHPAASQPRPHPGTWHAPSTHGARGSPTGLQAGLATGPPPSDWPDG